MISAWWLLAAALAGAFFGFFVGSLLASGSDADDSAERRRKDEALSDLFDASIFWVQNPNAGPMPREAVPRLALYEAHEKAGRALGVFKDD